MINLSTNFEVTQGSTWELDIAYESEDGSPINISNYTIVAEVRDKPGGLVCATATNGDGIEMVVDEHYNRFIMTFSGEKTAKFAYPKAAYQIRLVEIEDELMSGWLKVDNL